MKRVLVLLFVSLLFTQIFFSSDAQNIFISEISKESLAEYDNVYLNVAETACIGSTTVAPGSRQDIAPQVENLKVTKNKLVLDIEQSSVWKIVFLSISAAVIVAIIVILTIKMRYSGKK